MRGQWSSKNYRISYLAEKREKNTFHIFWGKNAHSYLCDVVKSRVFKDSLDSAKYQK